MLRFDRKQQNSVKQLSFNKKKNYKKMNKISQCEMLRKRNWVIEQTESKTILHCLLGKILS